MKGVSFIQKFLSSHLVLESVLGIDNMMETKTNIVSASLHCGVAFNLVDGDRKNNNVQRT